jgi:hypothetical protein
LSDELDDLNEDVQGGVARHHRLRALREQRIDDALKSEIKDLRTCLTGGFTCLTGGFTFLTGGFTCLTGEYTCFENCLLFRTTC